MRSLPALLVGAALLVTGCSAGTPAAQTPPVTSADGSAEFARAWTDAYASGNPQNVYDLMCSTDQKTRPVSTWNTQTAQQTKDAKVTAQIVGEPLGELYDGLVTTTSPGGGGTEDFHVRKENGQWCFTYDLSHPTPAASLK